TLANNSSATIHHYSYLELHNRYAAGNLTYHFDRGLAAPPFARKVSCARLVISREDLLLSGFDIASGGNVEEAVPRRDDRAGLGLGEILRRRRGRTGQQERYKG